MNESSARKSGETRVRFAPSPTGALHLGGARTAIFNWLYARANGGKFILRIEDTDRERSTKESIDEILRSLDWLGIDWDEGPFYQTERFDLYREKAVELLNAGKAYKCYCTTEELDARRAEQQAKGEKPKYDGKCRNLASALQDKPHVIRFMIPEEGETVFHDILRGEVRVANAELDDLIILRTDGTPTYNFTVVVDDTLMRMTHVIRGDDHLSNTPRQVQMYRGLNFPTPEFCHVSMILGADKKRLSKRHGATSVDAYRKDGFLPEAMFNYLVRLGWSHGDQEIFSRAELVQHFDIAHLTKSAAVFNPEKLMWLNQHYIKETPIEKLAELLMEFMTPENGIKPAPEKPVTTETIAKIIPLVRERAKTLVEMAKSTAFYFSAEPEYDAKSVEKFLTPEDAKQRIARLATEIETLPVEKFTPSGLEELFRAFAERESTPMKNIAQPVRVAVTGSTVSPPLFELMELMGRAEILARMKKFF